jgi:predicted P-loop ATPase
MANIRKPVGEATRPVTVTIKNRNLNRLDELYPDRSAAVNMAIEMLLNGSMTNTIEGLEL